MTTAVKAALAALMVVCATGAAGGPKYFIFDQPATLTCAPNQMCDLQLADDDSIQDIVTADSTKRHPDGWIIAQGTGAGYPHLYFTPQRPSGMSNVIITTTARTYYLTLSATVINDQTRYIFVVPDESGQIVIQQTPRPVVIHATPAPIATATPAPNADPGEPHFTGDGRLMPLSVTRIDNTIQLIYHADGHHVLPVIATPDEEGKPLPVPVAKTFQNDARGLLVVYTVLQQFPTLLLYSGTGSAQHTLTITWSQP